MKRLLMLLVLYAACAPTRPYTNDQAKREELQPVREPALNQLDAERATAPIR